MELRGNGQISVSGHEPDELMCPWAALLEGAAAEGTLERQPWGDHAAGEGNPG
ncbi:hypothetical protein [Aeromicrobium sp.]|uniref:hypothetical protein n=1 Tax=Aeromicrobium sp. TaxID=1871063 RepID=UPI00199D33E6|nr:hypothetical protein [Aeromicrobium sp.]MBC7633342.1 hypothetical protein [Aeromicrobium sp.]